jgi:hypothetical protein
MFESRFSRISEEELVVLTFNFVDYYFIPELFKMLAMIGEDIDELFVTYFDKLIDAFEFRSWKSYDQNKRKIDIELLKLFL